MGAVATIVAVGAAPGKAEQGQGSGPGREGSADDDWCGHGTQRLLDRLMESATKAGARARAGRGVGAGADADESACADTNAHTDAGAKGGRVHNNALQQKLQLSRLLAVRAAHRARAALALTAHIAQAAH